MDTNHKLNSKQVELYNWFVGFDILSSDFELIGTIEIPIKKCDKSKINGSTMKINTAHTRKKMFVYRNGELNPALTFIRHGKGYKGYGHNFKSYDSAVEWAATAGRAFMTSQDALQTD